MQAQVRWKLQIVGPDGTARSVPVSRDLLVGRDAEADLRLNDSSVSRRHAQLSLDPSGALFLEDLGSANGVEVDGRRSEGRTKLQAGAILKFGLFTLTAERVADPALERLPSRFSGALTGSKDRPPKGVIPVDPEAEKLPSQPALRFRTGPLTGRDVTLIAREIPVGRIAEGNEVVIPDESISRQHAVLTRIGRGYSLRDLQSVNGTAVNGARVITHLLKAGDRVRFGTVEADYFGPDAALAKPMDRGLLRRVILISTALLLAVGTWEVTHLVQVRRRADLSARPGQEEDGPTVERQLAEAETDRKDERWDKALASYQAALALDPLNADARKGIKEVQAESQMKQLFDRARQRVDVGQDEDGVETYLQIDRTSMYYPRAKGEVHRLSELLKRRYDEACRQSDHDRDYQGIIQGCGRYLNLVCNSLVDAPKLEAVRAAEAKLGAKNKLPPWSCPPAYARWFAEEAVSTQSSVETRIGERYKNPRLAEVVRIYANGQAKSAINRLGQLKVSPAEAHDPEVDTLLRQIGLAYGAYTDGVSALETGDLRSAQRHWMEFLDDDKQLMPDGDESVLASDARTQLAKQYFKQGDEMFVQSRFIEAYGTWDQGFKIKPGDNELQQGFIRLEQTANKLMENAARCPDLRLVLAITRPESLNHKRATDLVKEQHCQL